MIDSVPPDDRPALARHGRVGFDPQLDAALRRLARRLVGDPGGADDVVQDAWHAALAAPEVARPGAWLATLTRRLAARRRRERLRREDVERMAAKPGVASGAEVHDRDAALASLEDALAGLAGRRREVLWLRYAEGFRLHEIADRLRIPLGTVKSDHAEGLRFLRRRMDRRYGSRAAWALALSPLPSEAARSLEAPSVVNSAWAWISVAAVALSAVAGVAWFGAAHAPNAAQPEDFAASTPLFKLTPASPWTQAPAERNPLTESPAPPSSEPQGLAPVAKLQVIVHAGESGLAGGIVRVLGQDFSELTRGVTGADGALTVELPLDSLRPPLRPGGGPVCALGLGAFDRAVPHFHFVELDPTQPREVHIELAEPELIIAGHVVSSTGVPLPGARVWIDSGATVMEPLAEGHWRQRRTELAEADSNGAFVAARLAPGIRRIKVAAPGHVGSEFTREFPVAGRQSLVEPIVLLPSPEISGVVTDILGRPVEGARVWLEHQDHRLDCEVAQTDASGRFTLLSASPGENVVWASYGAGTERRTASHTVELGAGERFEGELCLDSRGLGTLRLVDEQGAPLADWRVQVQVADLETPRGFVELLQTDQNGEVQLGRDPGAPVRVRLIELPRSARATRMPVASWVLDGPWEGVREHSVAGALAPRASLSGRFIDLEGGDPRTLTPIVASLQHSVSLRLPVEADGRFTVTDLPAGEYVLYTARPNGVSVAVAFPPLAPGESRALGELRIGSTPDTLLVRD